MKSILFGVIFLTVYILLIRSQVSTGKSSNTSCKDRTEGRGRGERGEGRGERGEGRGGKEDSLIPW